MEDIVFYESLKITEWKTNKFQNTYNHKLEEMITKFIDYVEDNNYGKIDIKNKSISITYSDVPRASSTE